MKRSNLSKVVAASVLSLGMAVVPFTVPASAQNSNGTSTTSTSPSTTSTTTTTAETPRQDRGFDWGWLGLIGLAGLAGLAGKKAPERYRDPAEGTRTGYTE